MENEPKKLFKLMEELKENKEDFEFYPTTREMVEVIYKDIKEYNSYGSATSILDIGAGDGNFFDLLESFEPIEKEDNFYINKYAIEKSLILIEKMPSDIFLIGTDFMQQSLLDKKVDIIFCNPPYSEYELWVEKIITESNCKNIYLIIPERWKKNDKILELIKRRNFAYEVLANTDFEDSEFRQARAKVDIIKISRTNRSTDPFDLWFDNFFNIKTGKGDTDYYVRDTNNKKREEIKNNLVKGQNLIERLEEFYKKDFELLLKNYKTLETLDPELFEELGISLGKLKENLKMKIEGLKNFYWKELFDNLDKLTNRLTTKSRENLLGTLMRHTSVDFTISNVYAVVIWAIKNANMYFDSQLKDVYQWITKKENIINYKSNKRIISDDWRYCKEHTHYKLDYRLVVNMYKNFADAKEYGSRYDYPNNLHRSTHEAINDFIVIAKNLGFIIDQDSFDFEWVAGKETHFTLNGNIFISVRAYKNGNIHIKADQQFMKKFNIEAARLNGWIKSPEEASKEMDIPLKDVKDFYGSNLQIKGSNEILMIT